MPGSKEYSSLAATLSSALGLTQPPVAVAFSASLPEGMSEHAGRVPAGCRFWEDAATAAFATSSKDHSLCSIGVYTHHLEPTPAQQTDLMDALKVFNDLSYVTPQDLASIPVRESLARHVLYAPLAIAPFPPEVVLLFVQPSQTLILSEAVQQVENRNAPAMGRPACAVVPQVVNTGHAALSLGCCGARAYLDVLQDETAIFALPVANLAAYVERVDALSKANHLLSAFHGLRRKAVESGETPTVQESLAAMQA